ncbi:MAG: maleylpyruvate isomerase N-terminal domain-containing protein, partial [Actinobacteria bacterium]|nr:maleylpyruvate isomerase N-terminal domain-containing protein [Actinomycetota bacterium]
MAPAAYASFDVPGYVGALRRQGELLAGAAQRAGLTAVVPSCPGWAVRDLLKHTGYVHRWATGFVAEGLTRPGGSSEKEILSQGPADAELLGWFCEGHAALVRALNAAAPDLNCWAFLAAPSPLAFWARRQAHETAIHRVDAERAASTRGQPASAAGPAA